MITTVKRLSISLNKGDWEELNFLAEKFGESKSAVYRRALIILHTLTLEKEKEK